MPWRRKSRAHSQGIEPPAEHGPETSGALPAMDHVANWVRFADVKAALLSAGVAAVLAMAINHVQIVIDQLMNSAPPLVLQALAISSVLSFVWTLLWVLAAILPHKGDPSATVNRFAWPALATRSSEQLRDHLSATTADEDAWEQARALSKIAARKFKACSRATVGFAAFVLSTAACIVLAAFQAHIC